MNSQKNCKFRYKVQGTGYKLRITSILLFLVISLNLNGAPLKNIPVTLNQPNGVEFQCFASGDEFFNYLHDENGYTIIQNAEGYYVYAIHDGDAVVPSSFVIGSIDPVDVGIPQYVLISEKEYLSRRTAWFDFEDIPRPKHPGKNNGTLNNLVVFIRFADENNIPTPFSTIENIFNNQTPGYNSMINYFRVTSYGHLLIPSHFFPEPEENLILSYQDENPRDYYRPYNSITNPIGYLENDRTEREHELLRKAVEYISDMVPVDLDLDYDNNGYVDNVCFVVSGNVDGWNDLLWPHRWSLYSKYAAIHGKRVWDFNLMLVAPAPYWPFNPAVLSHEMQHTLSFPDLYHYAAPYGTPSAVGNWDIMEANPDPPQQSGAYMKWKYGNWLPEPTTIQPGKYSIYSNGSGLGFTGFKIPSSEDSRQFFVMEYRCSSDPFENFDYGNVNGMLIYRINDRWNGNAAYNGNNVFDEVYIFRPGGNSPLQGGQLNQAHFGANGRTTFDATTNPKPFLTDGTYITDLSLSDIVVANNKISFTYNGGTTHFYGVAFHPNGSDDVMHPQLFEEEVEQALKQSTFTRDGYVFKGWALTPDGEVVYDDEQSITIEDDVILYAVWTPFVYYSITASLPPSNGLGTIEPEGVVEVLENTDQMFVIEALYSNFIVEIIVDGTSYYPQNDEEAHRIEYIFENVNDNHTIEALFSHIDGVNENVRTSCVFNLQPNPAKDFFEIVFPSEICVKGANAQIFDVQGLLLKTITLYDEKTQVDISNLAKGFYIVKIDKEAKKLIINK